MKNKIRIFIICTMLIFSTISILGSAEELKNTILNYQDPQQNYRLKVKDLNDGRLPPNPGEIAPDYVFGLKNNIQKTSDPQVKSMQSTEETIIDILENIGEELILGYLEDLVAFGPRVTGSGACQAAGTYIYNEFVSYGLEARYDDWSSSGYSSKNIEGTLPGIDETSDEIYIITAHYDSVPGSPGADDDGSGTAAVLAAAKIMSQYEFNFTIRFVAFSGEEQGLLGSYEYVEEAYGNGDNIVADLNGDMIGYATNPTEASYIKVYEDTASQWITDLTEDVSQNYNEYIGLTVVPSGPAYNSDHASFWEFGYNAVMYHEYRFNDYYHSPQDTIEHMDIDYSTRVSRLIIATLGELAEAQPMSEPPATPTKPSGPETWTINVEATFSSTTTDPEGGSVYYLFDWEDGTDSGWVGPYASGQTGTASHIWTDLGEYNIKAMAKDDYNVKSDWSEPSTIIIVENEPPEKPTISGPKIGTLGKLINFKFSSIDPEGNDLYYYIYWDDGDYENWIGPYASGEEVTFGHTWSKAGVYTINIRARDQYGAKSQITQLKLTITRGKAINNLVLHQSLEKLMNRYPILKYILDR